MSKQSGSKPAKRREDLENELENLQDQLRLLQTLPGDFRDIQPHSAEWKLYQELVPSAVEAMDQWAHGKVLCLGKAPSPLEMQTLQKVHKEVLMCEMEPAATELTAFMLALHNAEAEGCAFVYLKGFPNSVTAAVNYLASFFKLRIRAKHEYQETHPRTAAEIIRESTDLEE